jgi:hypothetical protein
MAPVRPDQKTAVSGAVINTFAAPSGIDIPCVRSLMLYHPTIVAMEVLMALTTMTSS